MLRGYGEEQAKELMPRTMSTQNKLQKRKEELEKELKAVNEAIVLFQDHPEISDALDLLGQIRF